MSRVSNIRQGGQGNASAGGGGSDLGARVTVLEVKADNLQRTLDEIKTDVRELRNWGLGAVAAMLALGGTAFAALWQKSSEVEKTNTEIAHQNAAVVSSLERIERRIGEAAPPGPSALPSTPQNDSTAPP